MIQSPIIEFIAFRNTLRILLLNKGLRGKGWLGICTVVSSTEKPLSTLATLRQFQLLDAPWHWITVHLLSYVDLYFSQTLKGHSRED